MIRARGIALVAVLWMVAALSIIATGITRVIREEARMMSIARQTVQAQALGDAAIQIALQRLAADNRPILRTGQSDVTYGGVTMAVEVMPLNGLIDINAAPPPLLARLYTIAGGLAPGAGDALAQATVEARERRSVQGRQNRFEAEEDLLRVPGVTYDLYARLSGLITADLRSAGRVNPMAAPLEVLTVLAGGNAAAASLIVSKRDSGQDGIDTTALDPGSLDAGSVRRLRIQARVPTSDGTWLRVTRFVDLNARTRDGAPWHTFRTSTSVESAPRNNS